MKMMNMLCISLLLSFISIASAVNDQERKAYIVYMGSLPDGEYSPSLHHSNIINKVIDPSFASKSLIRSYLRSFNGFAAYLSEQERQNLASFDGILSVFPSRTLQLHTTRSWDYMGVSRRTKRVPVVESNVIVGIIDTGIWPESDSFSDKGLGPIPAKWKGGCYGGKNFTCNRKIIGARNYDRTYPSARDDIGHGTHVASIIAGNEIEDASYYGLARGTARGGVPSARIAVYKVCTGLCNGFDVLAAFDDAIADGVDIVSISIGPFFPAEITSDPMAIGAFHAMEKGILTVSSAGNMGPITSIAPWIFTVAESTIDRRIIDKVLIGDGTTVTGTSINAFPSSNDEVPLVYGKEVTSNCSETDARNCHKNCLDSRLAKQKVIICDKYLNIDVVIEAGALGCIVPQYDNVSFVMPLPVVALVATDMNMVKTYQNLTKEPTARILKSETVNNSAAPLVSSLSSKGPNKLIPNILKPDITAPGVEILAAFPPTALPSGNEMDKMSVKYNILSGTSVAAPHVAAASAFLKSFHPEWSPSALKSALMTTAWEMDPLKNPDAEFGYGSGHIDPIKAKDPGLVYETFKEDYMKVWCNIATVYGIPDVKNSSCHEKLTPKDLNYPSMAAQVDTQSAFEVSFRRTVTNVGQANSTYVASVTGGSQLEIIVKPKSLRFKALNQKKSFLVTVWGNESNSQKMESMALVWTDGFHRVRSPIVVYPVEEH